MFQTRILLGGGMEMHDRFRDWRLDVDNMSYEVLNFVSRLFSLLLTQVITS